MALELRHVDYVYDAGGPYEKQALTDISLSVEDGTFLCLIGQTGSGKSTLLQILGGLLLPTGGQVLCDGRDIHGKDFSMRHLREMIGMVFQYPEYQLFEATVLKDAAFGPKNLGASEEEALQRAREGLRLANLPEQYWEISPFELSGGEKRRAAIAGVLAMNPKILVMDEPTAGLDPQGRRELFAMLTRLHAGGMTIVLVSHSMEDVAEYAERAAVLQEGRLLFDGTPKEVFSHKEELEAIHLALPEAEYLARELAELGVPVDPGLTRFDEVKEAVLAALGRQ